MTVRQLRKLRQAMLGYYHTKSYRTPSGGPDPFTGRKWPPSSTRVRIGTAGRYRPWRGL